MGRVAHAVGTSYEGLENLAWDWAAWDDTYDFVQEPNDRYVRSNLPDAFLSQLRIDLFAIVDEHGDVIWSRMSTARGGSRTSARRSGSRIARTGGRSPSPICGIGACWTSWSPHNGVRCGSTATP